MSKSNYDEQKPLLATDPKTLSEQIMSESTPKTEREWWAKRRIEECQQTILDCWELLQIKPRQKQPWLSTRLRNEELIENQEGLINQLRETLEPIVNKINEGGDTND